MLERGLLSRILFPAPAPSYSANSFPRDLIWIPKGGVARAERPSPGADTIPCLLLTYPSARFLIIFFHSNAEDLGRCRSFCCYLREQFQVHVLAVEYPGYGLCPGVPSGESVMENAMSALRFVTDTLRWPLDSIKVFGRSIGTGPAMALASLFSFAGVILVTPFLSVQELFRDRVGPFAALVEEWFANKDAAPRITSPTMIIHGQRDELIACRHGELLYELLRSRKLLVSPPDMEHNTNLLSDLQFFVLPMFQFFTLPDYVFQDLQVPGWVYSHRRSPGAAVPATRRRSSLRAPGENRKRSLAVRIAPGTVVRKGDTSQSSSADTTEVVGGPSTTPRKAGDSGLGVAERAPLRSPGICASGGTRAEACEDDGVSQLGSFRWPKALQPRALEADPMPGPVGETDEAIRRLQELAGRICQGELCSDELCVIEEGPPLTAEQRSQEQAFQQLVQTRQVARPGDGPGSPSRSPPAPPRLLAPMLLGESVDPCTETVLGGWCGSGRAAVDLHEAPDVPEDATVARPRWVHRLPAPRSRNAPGRQLATPQPPSSLVASCAWGRIPMPLFAACCSGGVLAEPAVELASPQRLGPCSSSQPLTGTEEELLTGVTPAFAFPRGNCAISI